MGLKVILVELYMTAIKLKVDEFKASKQNHLLNITANLFLLIAKSSEGAKCFSDFANYIIFNKQFCLSCLAARSG